MHSRGKQIVQESPVQDCTFVMNVKADDVLWECSICQPPGTMGGSATEEWRAKSRRGKVTRDNVGGGTNKHFPGCIFLSFMFPLTGEFRSRGMVL